MGGFGPVMLADCCCKSGVAGALRSLWPIAIAAPWSQFQARPSAEGGVEFGCKVVRYQASCLIASPTASGEMILAVCADIGVRHED